MTEAERIVGEFWRLMGTNDFYAVSAVLAPEFTLDWPQSGERIRGGSGILIYKVEESVRSSDGTPRWPLWGATIKQ